MGAQQDAVEAQAVYLIPPHGELIWKGDKTLVAKIKKFKVDGREYLLASGDLIYGRVKFGQSRKVKLAEFNRLQPKHQIKDTERKKWWKDAKVFHVWPVTMVQKFEPPKPFERPTGVQTFISDVVYKEGTDDLQLMPTKEDDGLARGPAVIVDSVDSGGVGGNKLAKYVVGLLDGFQQRLYMGQHHDAQGPAPAQMVKAEGEEVEPSSMPSDESMYASFMAAGALNPPLPPDFFLEVLRISNILRQCIDVYATNIDGFGHHFDPVLDLDSDDAWRLVKRKLRAESKERNIELPEGEKLDGVIEERLERYRTEAALEKSRLEAFFANAGHRQSFIKLRKITRADSELTGYDGWEVLRNARGEVAKFKHVPAYTLRLMPADKEPTQIIEKQRHGAPWEVKEVPVWCHFRRFIHYQGGGRTGGRIIYFRDFLDPRTVSRTTGRYYQDTAALKREEDEAAKPANELIYFSDGNLDSPYGEPRWLGNLLSVLGSRSSEEVNFLFFQNKSIPPLVIMLSGANVKQEDVEALKNRIRDELHGGTDKFHKVLIITANVDPQTGLLPDIKFQPLTEALMKDALFSEYDKGNRSKVQQSMRIPQILIGDIKDFNRATASAALRFAEAQVFQGLREDFDWMINHLILPVLGAQYWRFVSNGPPLRDPQDVVEMVSTLSKEAIITPAEARRELAAIGFKLDKIEEPWTLRPLAVTALGVGFEPEKGERVVAGGDASDPESTPMEEKEAMQLLEGIMQDAVREGKIDAAALQRMNLQSLRRHLRGAGPDDEDDGGTQGNE